MSRRAALGSARTPMASGRWASKESFTGRATRLGQQYLPLRRRSRVCPTFQSRLQASGPRVIKQNRGNGRQGVRKVELVSAVPISGDSVVRVLHAQRSSVPEELSLSAFTSRYAGYFAADGCVIDQPFQPRPPSGVIRCYMGGDKVVGFGHQLIKALIPPPLEGPDSPQAQPEPPIMHGRDAESFQALRAKVEGEWTPQMMEVLGIAAHSLPIIWDADFLYGPRTAAGEDTYVLCEISVSSCFALPEQAPPAIAQLSLSRLKTSITEIEERMECRSANDRFVPG
jgi:hypothetical protein